LGEIPGKLRHNFLEYSFERLLGMARIIKPGFIDFF
jgi:hypothetical protein